MLGFLPMTSNCNQNDLQESCQFNALKKRAASPLAGETVPNRSGREGEKAMALTIKELESEDITYMYFQQRRTKHVCR